MEEHESVMLPFTRIIMINDCTQDDVCIGKSCACTLIVVGNEAISIES